MKYKKETITYLGNAGDWENEPPKQGKRKIDRHAYKYIILSAVTSAAAVITAFLLLWTFCPALFNKGYEGDVWTAEAEASDVVYYSGTVSDEPADSSSSSLPSVKDSGVTYYTSKSKAAAALRKKMVARKSSCTVYLLTSESDTDSLVDELYELAIEYTGNGFEGDYLFRHIATYSSTSETDYPCVVTKTKYKEGTLVKFTYSFKWRDTAEQEEAVEKELNKVLAKIIDDDMSDYEKADAIYYWIMTNVTYDYDRLEVWDPLIHTAYDALINHNACCLGFSNTFYLMANEAGLKCRVIGTAGHVWNMVEVDDEWYLVDVTFAATYYNYGYSTTKCYHFFLCGSGSDFSKSHDDPVTTFGETVSYYSYNPISSATLSYTSCTYNGSARKPSVTVKNSDGKTLTKGTHYTVTYKNNTNAGTATVIIKGIGKYAGTITKKFTIKKKSLTADSTAAKLTLSYTSCTYNGSARKPGTTLKITLSGSSKKLTKNTDYTVTYSNNKNAGTATVTVKGKGNYSGTIKKTFKIKKKNISSDSSAAVVTLGTSSGKYYYTGKSRHPSTTVTITLGGKKKTLTRNTNYTVSYSNNKEIGTGKITITGKGNYTGTITKTFKIVPEKITVTSAKSSSSKKITVKWEKAYGVSGSSFKYQIRYKVKGTSEWKIKTVSSSKLKYTLTKLKSGKTYVVQVRAYKKKSSSTIYYGVWSKSQYITVK